MIIEVPIEPLHKTRGLNQKKIEQSYWLKFEEFGPQSGPKYKLSVHPNFPSTQTFNLGLNLG